MVVNKGVEILRNLSKDLENKNIDYEKLLECGFKKIENIYFLEKLICDNYFKVIIEISKHKQISKVMDLAIDEEYVLVDIQDSVGDFVGKVRDEYENILNDILKKCTTPNIFKSKQAKAIIKYVKEKYNDDLEYLWVKFPNNAIWRNKDNNKWYGALLILSESKLGIESDKIIDILDLRYQKDQIRKVIDNKRIFEGYHMNKDNWITIRLDGSVDLKEIFDLIDNSYKLSLIK